MHARLLTMALTLTAGLGLLPACKHGGDLQGDDCVEQDILATKSGKTYVAKVFALNFASQFAADAKEARARFDEMQSLGITDVMLLEPAFATDYVQQALHDSKLRPWMISQVFFNNSFYDPEIPDSDPRWAITDTGDVAWDTKNNGWLRMACPNNGPSFDEAKPDEGFRQQTIARMVDLVKIHRPYGVSLDFIRYFSFWEGVAKDADPQSLPDTCFCDRCLALFQEQAHITLPDTLNSVADKAAWIHREHLDEWTAFKTNTITRFVAEAVAAIHQANSDVKINLHAVPWKQGEYDHALQRIVGQDLPALAEHLDWISPMVYAKMKQRPAAWISEVVDDVAGVIESDQVAIIPAIQIEADGGDEVTTQDFEDYLQASLAGSSAGVALWPWERITDEQKAVLHGTLDLACASSSSQ